MQEKKIRIYIGAGLFNGADTVFNALLSNSLESQGYTTNLPQRDGFEFGNLHKKLGRRLPPNKVQDAVQAIIHYFDMGVLIPNSHVMLSRMDEPLDAGLMVETTYANFIDRYVLGVRTDVRTPYGSIHDKLKGVHFFPALRCDAFIYHPMRCRNASEASHEFALLARRIDAAIAMNRESLDATVPSYALSNPRVGTILKAAQILFKRVQGASLNQSLDEVVSRYIENQQFLDALVPELF